jgi:WD40 repeat protein
MHRKDDDADYINKSLTVPLRSRFTNWYWPFGVRLSIQSAMSSGVCLSANDLHRAWRYAVATDFQDLSDDPKPIETVELPYASNDRRLPFERLPTSLDFQHAFSADERWFALAVGEEIDLYDLTTEAKITLCGHNAEIRCLAFSPNKSSMLVTSASGSDRTIDSETNEVFIWDLQQSIMDSAERVPPNQVEEWTNDLVEGFRNKLSSSTPPLPLEQAIEDSLTRTLSTLFGRIGNRPSARKIHGRLCHSFQSSMFSHDGKVLIILPGATPESNGDHAWDITLHHLEQDHEITLTGHRDMIMWTSFTPDDKRVISAAWDGTFRVWHPQTGECLWVWNTHMQNWTGAISPDSKHFLGTDGEGNLWVRDLETGDLRSIVFSRFKTQIV